MFGSVASDDRDVTGPESVDPSVGSFQLDDVARFNRSVREENEPAYEVGDNFLEPESQAESESAAKDRERREVDADRCQADDHGQDDEEHSDDLLEKGPGRGIDAGNRFDPLFDQLGESESDPDGDCEREADGEEIPNRQRLISRRDRELHLVEKLDEAVVNGQEAEGREDVDDQRRRLGPETVAKHGGENSDDTPDSEKDASDPENWSVESGQLKTGSGNA